MGKRTSHGCYWPIKYGWVGVRLVRKAKMDTLINLILIVVGASFFYPLYKHRNHNSTGDIGEWIIDMTKAFVGLIILIFVVMRW